MYHVAWVLGISKSLMHTVVWPEDAGPAQFAPGTVAYTYTHKHGAEGLCSTHVVNLNTLDVQCGGLHVCVNCDHWCNIGGSTVNLPFHTNQWLQTVFSLHLCIFCMLMWLHTSTKSFQGVCTAVWAQCNGGMCDILFSSMTASVTWAWARDHTKCC